MADDPPPAGGGGDHRPKKRTRPALTVVQGAIAGASPAGAPGADIPFGFEMRADGLWRLPSADKSPYRVCGPFDVVAESRPDDHARWGLLLEWRDRDGKPHTWIMPRSMLAGEAVEVRARMADCGLDVGAHEGARRALVEFLSAVKVPARVRTVPRTGWHWPAAGGAVFVLPAQAIGGSGAEVIRLDIDPAPTHYRQRGTLADWRREVAARCVGNSRLVFGVACGFAATLLALAEEEGGGFNLRGGSSRGKTTVVDAGASVWGAPSKSGPDSFTRSWRHTDNALEATCAAHNHVLLPLDELGQADPGTLPETLYMIANGQGKGRSRAGGGNRPGVSWLTLVLSSSEESAGRLVEQGRRRFKAGQEVRLLDIPAEVAGAHGAFEALHGDADGAAFAGTVRRAVLAQHGTAGPAFVAWLAARLAAEPDLLAAELLPRIAAWAREVTPPGADGQVQRAARRLALVAIGGELASEAGVTGWPAGAASAAVAAIFRAWVAERGGVGAREDADLFTAFREFIGKHGPSRFAVVRDDDTADDGAQVEPRLPDGDRTQPRFGWRWQEATDSGERRWVHGVLPEVFDTEIAAPLGMEGRDATARLGKAGLIRGERSASEQRWRIKVRRIPGAGRPRLIVTALDILESG